MLVWDATAVPRGGPVPADEPGEPELEGLWADLAGDDAGRAYRAMGRLAAASEQAVPFLRKHLEEGATQEGRRLARLIADLDSEDFATRERATDELAGLGRLAERPLRKALEGNPSAELQRRVKQLLDRLEKDPRPAPPAAVEGPVVAVRGVEVLGRIGTEEARRVLAALAQGDPDARLTREARASLRRLGE